MATTPGQPGDRHDASASKTSLSDRELLGEIDHASTRDRAPEAWFLAATRDAPEQLEQDLLGKSDLARAPASNGASRLAQLTREMEAWH